MCGFFFQTPCPLCGAAGSPLESPLVACGTCRDALRLTPGGVLGSHPLPWWAAGLYSRGWLPLLQRLRQSPRAAALHCLASGVPASAFEGRRRPLLAPIPSWKRQGGNRLPERLARTIARQRCLPWAHLLERSRPVLGQHHLRRRLRHLNQRDAFHCRRSPSPSEAMLHPILIVDDILTTGATAGQAAETLIRAGWNVAGTVCLARATVHRP